MQISVISESAQMLPMLISRPGKECLRPLRSQPLAGRQVKQIDGLNDHDPFCSFRWDCSAGRRLLRRLHGSAHLDHAVLPETKTLS